MRHKSQPDVDRRLARIVGHLEGVRRMLEADKPCIDVLQQMKAVIAALTSAREIVAKDHVRQCIAEAINKGNTAGAVEEVEAVLSQIL